MTASSTPQDDLMAELNGTGAGVTLIDAPEHADMSDPLEVKAPAGPKSAVAKLAATAKPGLKGYAVTVRGEYFAPSKDQAGKKIKLPYTVVVNVPVLTGALSTIRKHLLTPALLKLDPLCSGPRTYEIVDARPLSAEMPENTNIQFMPREALEAHIKHVKAPIDPKQYPDVTVLRAALIDFTVNPAGFEEREAEKQVKRAELNALNALNPDIEAAPAE